MGFPASEIPAHSAYRVAINSSAGSGSDFMAEVGAVAGALLEPAHVPVAGTESFDSATVVLVSAAHFPFRDFSARADSLRVGAATAGFAAESLGATLAQADLWLIPASRVDEIGSVLGRWMACGAGAVAVFCGEAVSWFSRNGAFGQARGQWEPAGQITPPPASAAGFVGGVVFAMVEELLGENLFDKASPTVDRECLEMRPLHLRATLEAGLAAAGVFGMEDADGLRGGAALGKVREWLRVRRGPQSHSWGKRR